MEINSVDYWETRFLRDWEANSGREQSRFFAELLVANLPNWFKRNVAIEAMTICDWGCAEGDGTNVLATHLMGGQLTGVDFSLNAIEKARSYYKGERFLQEDWLSDSFDNPVKYDVVVSSNTLEHFHDPKKVLNKLTSFSNSMVVLALPYEEVERISEHHFTFLAGNIPFYIDGNFHLIHAKTIDCKVLDPSYWGGSQIVLIYGRGDFLARNNLSLFDVELQSEAEASLRAEKLILVEQKTKEKEEFNLKLNEFNLKLNELNSRLNESSEKNISAQIEINNYKNSMSWKLTAPLRVFYSFLRHLLKKNLSDTSK